MSLSPPNPEKLKKQVHTLTHTPLYTVGQKNETTLVRPTAATVQDKIKRISERDYENTG